MFRSAHITRLFAYGITGAMLLLGCSADGGEPARSSDTTSPTVSATRPARNTERVHINTAISAIFSEAVDPITLTTATFTVSAGGTAVPGSVTRNGMTATFTPASGLSADTTYTATLTPGVKDLAGNPVTAKYSWSFTTGVWNKVFVTSVSGNGNLASWADAGGNTGLAAADAVCQARATAAGLPGSFKAWLSDDHDDAYCRVHNLAGKKLANCGQATLPASAGPWVRMDRFPFSERIDQLARVNARIYAPVKYDEFGKPVPAGVASAYFTGTHPTGTLHPSNLSSCANWTRSSTAPSVTAVGTPDVAMGVALASYGASCASTRPLVCMQTGAGPALPLFDPPDKQAIVTHLCHRQWKFPQPGRAREVTPAWSRSAKLRHLPVD